METVAISVKVTPQAAEIYEQAPESTQVKVGRAVEELLAKKPVTHSSKPKSKYKRGQAGAIKEYFATHRHHLTGKSEEVNRLIREFRDSFVL